MRKLFCFTFLMIAIYQTPLVADSALKKSQRSVKAINSLKLDFELEMYSSLRKRTRTRTGKGLFSKPSSFRWRFDDKYGRETYFFNGSKLSHYKESENLVLNFLPNSGFSKELIRIVEMILDHNKLAKVYDVTQQTDYLTELKPRGPQNTEIKKIAISLTAPNRRYVSSIAIHYQDSNISTYRFKNQSVPKKTPKKSFVFINPGTVKEKTMK